MFPTDPNAPGGPGRSEYLWRDHLGRTPVPGRVARIPLREGRPTSRVPRPVDAGLALSERRAA